MKISLIGLLQVMFIGFRIDGVIDWSWWLVMLPMLASTALHIGYIAYLALKLWMSL